MNTFLLKGLKVGFNAPLRVNCNVGINTSKELPFEVKKIKKIFSDKKHTPDIMMDLSTIDLKLYKWIMNEKNIPVGTVPIYLMNRKHPISDSEILDLIESQARDGIAFFTFHFTADLNLLDIAKKTRGIPVTSRGGSITLRDMQKNKSKNIFLRNIDEITKLAIKYDFAISLGSTFRPASITNALDKVHIQETKAQLKVAKFLESKNVKCILENIGHIKLSEIDTFADKLKNFNIPIMPLGPMVTDIGLELDDIVSGIGATYAATKNIAHIINSITSVEHIHSKIGIPETLKAIKIAKMCSHIINISKNYKEDLLMDENISNIRAKSKSCIQNENCNRCINSCPLKYI